MQASDFRPEPRWAKRPEIVAMSAVVFSILGACARAENWPGWRGPRGDGSSAETTLPLRWNGETGENIAWKVSIPGRGHSSPIVWKDRVFVSSCAETTGERMLVCLDAKSGRSVWQKVLLTSPLETIHRLNSHASGTPATDGRLVYVAFLQPTGEMIEAPNVGKPRQITPGRIRLFAVDFDGHVHWQVDVGDFVSAHGFCSCPVLHEDLVILNGDHDGQGYLVAFNKVTGEEVWRSAREHGIRSYVTPIVRSVAGQKQLVLSGSGHVAAFDPSNGKRIWSVQGPTEQYVASMVFDDGHYYLAAGFPTHHVMAIRADGKGDVSGTHVAWHVDKHVRCYVPSPVLLDGRLYVADDRGTGSCFLGEDGKRVWQGRLSGGFSSSLVATSEYVLFVDNAGVTKIVKPADELQVVAENPLGEECRASPALSEGSIYLRGVKHLYCIRAE